MKAIQFAEYGDPSVLQLVDVPEPHAGPGQVRIAVHAAGVNAYDWKLRSGAAQQYAPLDLPSGTGTDASGTVDEVGDGVTGVRIGDEVFGAGSDTYAEYAVLTSWVPKPSGLSFEEAAGYPVPVETAVRILDEVAVPAGGTLLVSGASGGVGSAAVQIAVDRGITVVATAGPANQDYLRSLGAVPTTYGDGLVERVRALEPAGVDAALDISGSGVIPELIEITGDPAAVVSIADFGAPQLGARVSTDAGDMTAALTQAARLHQAGSLSIPVQQAFPLADAAQAQQRSADGHVTGRLVISVR